MQVSIYNTTSSSSTPGPPRPCDAMPAAMYDNLQPSLKWPVGWVPSTATRPSTFPPRRAKAPKARSLASAASEELLYTPRWHGRPQWMKNWIYWILDATNVVGYRVPYGKSCATSPGELLACLKSWRFQASQGPRRSFISANVHLTAGKPSPCWRVQKMLE